jgi:isopenicillin-N N-acyltransferase like protein
MFPLITVSGGSYERGHQYGTQARARIHRSVAAYARQFQYEAGWDWPRTTAQARRFLPAIEDLGGQYVKELAGIADGADLDLLDILALNVRTEIMFSARIRTAMAPGAPAECTTFASVAADASVVVGQNWDWLPFASDTVVVLQALPDDGPGFVTVVEAGLLAKYGVNSSGVAVLTNALACAEDHGDPGVPYHVMLRALLECGSTHEGLALLGSAPKASSANYLLADREASVVDVEARPGGASAVHRLEPDAVGMLLHTNHFVSPDFDSVDYADLSNSTSRVRLDQIGDFVATHPGSTTVERFEAALADHTNEPDSVCRHPDETLPPQEQTMTVSSIVIDLSGRRILTADGPPCLHAFEALDTSWLWS